MQWSKKQVTYLKTIWHRCARPMRSAIRSAGLTLRIASVWAVMGTLLSACGEQIPSAVAQEGPSPGTAPPYEVVTNIRQTMAWIVFPAADVIWDSAGTIITAQGSEELAPTTPEAWAEVVHAAATLTEAGNLLMMPGRAVGEDWIRYSHELVTTGKLALQAAQAQDSDALFDAGGRVYEVCRSCHEQYWVEAPAQP